MGLSPGSSSSSSSPYGDEGICTSQAYICTHPKLRHAIRWLSKLQTDPVPLANPMTPEVAQELLMQEDYIPGPRPRIFRAGDNQWIFKENLGQRTAVYGQQQDRWHNSGGVKGARDLPADNPVRSSWGVTVAASHCFVKVCGHRLIEFVCACLVPRTHHR